MWVSIAARLINTHPLSAGMATFDTLPPAFPLMLLNVSGLDDVTVMHFRNGCLVLYTFELL